MCEESKLRSEGNLWKWIILLTYFRIGNLLGVGYTERKKCKIIWYIKKPKNKKYFGKIILIKIFYILFGDFETCLGICIYGLSDWFR